MTKFLGLSWNKKTDSLSIAVDNFEFARAKTPREMVKIGARIFDIEGWFSPFVVTGRALIQRAMRPRMINGVLVPWGWDKPVDEQLQKEFFEWASTIRHLAHYFVPRCWNRPTTVGCIPDLHVFGDASMKAYGATAYRVVKGVDGVIHSDIISAKGHVVPTDPSRSSHHNNITRLELVAAVKAVDLRKNCEKLATAVKENSKEKFGRTVMWTDSEPVLKQIFDQTTAPRGFVGNRIARIQDETSIDEWRYVPSSLNPADLITRGIRADETEKWAFFHKGPEFLRDAEERWPEMTVNRYPTPPDPIIIYASVVESTPIPLSAVLEMADRKGEWFNKVFRIASIVRAVRVWKTAVLRRAARNPFHSFPIVEKPATPAPPPATAPAPAPATATAPAPIPAPPPTKQAETGDEPVAATIEIDADRSKEVEEPLAVPVIGGDDYDRAEMALIKAIQEKHFADEKRDLQRWRIDSPSARVEIPRKSTIYPLNPFLDGDGVIRVGSRLAHANIDDEAKFPAILPKDDLHVNALIRHVHHETQHAGPIHVHNHLRQRFWIVQGLPTVKRAIGKCPGCQRADKRPCQQKMAELPTARVFDTHAWDTSGVDMMGPFGVKRTNSRATHKVYVALFTCFSTRSIHVELVNNMDADSFILALARFSARRPGLRHLYSDNGSNFVGGFNILSKRAKEVEGSCAATTHTISSKDLAKVRDSVRPRILKQGLDWTFLPPYASHYAGVWERMVGLVKRHLARISSGAKLHEDALHTALVQIEGIVNNRPLTAVPTNPQDINEYKPLRPRQILNPSFTGDLLPDFVADIPDEGEKMRYRYLAARERVRAFWKAWKEDYVTSLANRKKWTKSEKNLAVGDLVIIVDDTLQRIFWELGRVVEVDDEDHARKILVKRPNQKIICRDRSKLVHLELDEGLEGKLPAKWEKE